MKKSFSIFGIIAMIIFIATSCDPREETKKPTASFSYLPASGIEPGDVVTFTNTSTDFQNSEWNFGDGNVSVGESPTHKYEESGQYEVSLIVENKGLKDQTSQTVYVESSVIACFTVSPNPAMVGEELFFTNCSEGADSYEWDINSDGKIDSHDEIPKEFYFTVEGKFNVTLKAISGESSDEEVHELVVVPAEDEVTACFTMSPNPAAVDEDVYFTNCSEGADSYEWYQIGYDDIISTDKDPILYFPAAGTFEMKLIAKSGSSTDEVINQIVIEGGGSTGTDPADYWGVDWGDAIYFNNFDGTNSSGEWFEDSGDYWEAYIDISSGYYTMIDNSTASDLYGRYYYTNAADLPSGNWELETSMRNTIDNGIYGSGLMFGLDPDVGNNRFKFKNDQYYVNVYGNASGWTSTSDGYFEDWNKLTVRNYEGVYYFFLNEVFIYSEDAQDYGNKFGFSIDQNTHVDVDAIGVWPIISSSKSNTQVVSKEKKDRAKSRINTPRKPNTGKAGNNSMNTKLLK
ncbi:MAG: PKD domain-containing protein [Salinivirgaceae bacterium]|jgi:hypothetical protein|nr:PKD domain-containing protein [Salinivirgaceae bacterium]